LEKKKKKKSRTQFKEKHEEKARNKMTKVDRAVNTRTKRGTVHERGRKSGGKRGSDTPIWWRSGDATKEMKTAQKNRAYLKPPGGGKKI